MDSSVLCVIIFIGVLFLLGFIAWLLDSFSNLTESKKKFRQLLENENKTKDLNERLKKREQEIEAEFADKSYVLTLKSKELAKKSDMLNSEIAHYNSLISGLDEMIEKKCACYPQLAVIMADIKTAFYERSAQYLETKKSPAPNEALRIRELRKETQKILSEKKLLEYKFKYIEAVIPNINSLFDRDDLEDQITQYTSIVDIENAKKSITQEKQKLSIEKRNLSIEKQSLSVLEQTTKVASAKLEKKIAYYNSLIAGFDEVIKQKCSYYPQLAAIVADIETVFYERSAEYLETKKNPAIIEALRIRELRKETQKILAEKKLSDYRLEYIKTMFPNIEDIFDSDFAAPEDFELETDDTTDRTRKFLSHEEYASLSTTERNQLALDRYLESRKSKWQVGRDYELYIGYQYECHGYNVKYTGIIENFEDMGRDLIAQKGNKVLIIQCKNWSQEKTIHEKHIFQLFGTLILYQLENPTLKSSALFVTTTSLSEKAKEIAKHLNISVRENIALCDFPRIKCNINRQSGEKIYHLPFDQQYDTVVIEKDKGEFMAFTVAEAENAGFRRAFKHFASQ